MDAAVKRINDQWAHIRYQVGDRDAQYRQLDQLAGQAAQVVARYPGQAEPLLWQGIVTSEEAARASFFRQLGFAKQAKAILESAQAIDPNVADGGVKMSLGVLYYRVPGSPIGFGSTPKARELLQAALKQDPRGLDNNFFYADFLNDEGHPAEAKVYATARASGAAQSGPPGLGRGPSRRNAGAARQDQREAQGRMIALSRALGSQLARPRGLGGRLVAGAMRIANRRPTALAIAALDVRPGDAVLDFGCGAGDAIPALRAAARLGPVVGIDHANDMIVAARRRHPGREFPTRRIYTASVRGAQLRPRAGHQRRLFLAGRSGCARRSSAGDAAGRTAVDLRNRCRRPAPFRAGPH